MKHLSIRVKLIILVLIALIPLSILQVINIRRNHKISTEEKLQVNITVAQNMAKAFYNFIDELWIQESIIGSHISDELDDTEEIQRYIHNIVDTNKSSIRRLSWISPDGTIVACTSDSLIGQSVVERDYYKRIIAGEEKVQSGLLESYIDKTIIFPIAREVRKNGKLVGILALDIFIDKLELRITNFNLNQGDKLKLIDSNGRIVYNSERKMLNFEERQIPENSPIWETLQGKVVKNSKFKTQLDSSYRIFASCPIDGIGWACTVSSDRNTILKDIYKEAVRSTIIFLLISVISLVYSFKFGKKIADPLIVLKNKTDELKQGDYSVRTNISGNDEIAATAEAFDLMVDSIEQYDKMKNQFFINLSHEFKTPINVIYSGTQLIESLEKSLDDVEFKGKAIKNMGVIRQNCYRLMRLVDNIIDVTRCDSGYFKMNLHKLDIVNIIENISLSVVKFAEQKGVTIIFDTEMEEKEICCDPYMIERIVLNLISNALKFTDKGGFIYINIYDKKDKIVFKVRDTGSGMPEDKLSIIFDRFSQLDTSLNRNHEGSGLGLSIVKALVEAHKGNITVSSELGKGTEFAVELPSSLIFEDMMVEDKALFYNNNDTIQKIEIEFSDIYSIGKV